MHTTTIHRVLLAALTACTVLALGGCGSTLYDAQAAFKAGDTSTAEKAIKSYAAGNKASEHRVIAHLELGSILFARGKYEESVRAFEYAEAQMDQLDAQKEYKLTEELESAIKNPAEMTYRGTPYDRVMASTMLALGYCMLGDFDAARPMFKNAQFRQQEALRRRQELIDQAQKQAEEDRNLGNARSKAAERYTDAFFAGYETVSNSFANTAQAAFLLGQQLGTSDADEAGDLLKSVAAINSGNPYVEEDLAIAARTGGVPPDRTYVLFATGFVPHMVDIPIALPYPGGIATAAFPTLVPDGGAVMPPISIDANGRTYPVEMLADMDAIVGTDFNAELPLIITRHTVSALVKNGVGVGAAATANNVGGAEGALIQLAAIAYQIWQNKADIRSWQTLPGRFMYASFDTPADGVITLVLQTGDTRSVEVAPEGVSIVFVRAYRPNQPVTISAFSVGTGTVSDEPAAAEIASGPMQAN